MKSTLIAVAICAIWLTLFAVLAMPRGGEGLMVAASVHLRSFAVLIGLRSSVEDLVEFELRRELRDNPRVATAGSSVIVEHRSRIRKNTLQRFRLLREALGYSFVTILLACVAGVAVIVVRPAGPPLSLLFSSPRIAALTSMFCFAWATLGRLGWGGQSLGGQTVVEMLDELVFRFLYALGAFFAVMAVLL